MSHFHWQANRFLNFSRVQPGRDFIFLQANFSSLHQTTWNIFPSLLVSAEVYTSISFSSKFLVGSFNQYRSQGSQCPVLPNYLTTTFRLQQWLTETFEQEFAFVRHIDILFSSNPKLLPVYAQARIYWSEEKFLTLLTLGKYFPPNNFQYAWKNSGRWWVFKKNSHSNAHAAVKSCQMGWESTKTALLCPLFCHFYPPTSKKDTQIL